MVWSTREVCTQLFIYMNMPKKIYMEPKNLIFFFYFYFSLFQKISIFVGFRIFEKKNYFFEKIR